MSEKVYPLITSFLFIFFSYSRCNKYAPPPTHTKKYVFLYSTQFSNCIHQKASATARPRMPRNSSPNILYPIVGWFRTQRTLHIALTPASQKDLAKICTQIFVRVYSTTQKAKTLHGFVIIHKHIIHFWWFSRAENRTGRTAPTKQRERNKYRTQDVVYERISSSQIRNKKKKTKRNNNQWHNFAISSTNTSNKKQRRGRPFFCFVFFSPSSCLSLLLPWLSLPLLPFGYAFFLFLPVWHALACPTIKFETNTKKRRKNCSSERRNKKNRHSRTHKQRNFAWAEQSFVPNKFPNLYVENGVKVFLAHSACLSSIHRSYNNMMNT